MHFNTEPTIIKLNYLSFKKPFLFTIGTTCIVFLFLISHFKFAILIWDVFIHEYCYIEQVTTMTLPAKTYVSNSPIILLQFFYKPIILLFKFCLKKYYKYSYLQKGRITITILQMKSHENRDIKSCLIYISVWRTHGKNIIHFFLKRIIWF